MLHIWTCSSWTFKINHLHLAAGTIMRMLVEEFKFTVSSSEFEAPATIEATT